MTGSIFFPCKYLHYVRDQKIFLLILDHLLKKICVDIGRPQLSISNQALLTLTQYDWPGNVRELRNFAYKMAVKVKGNIITNDDLPKEFSEEKTIKKDPAIALYKEVQPVQLFLSSQQPQKAMNKMPSLKDQELNTILTVLNELNGNVTEAARRLGIHRSTIYKKLGRERLRILK